MSRRHGGGGWRATRVGSRRELPFYKATKEIPMPLSALAPLATTIVLPGVIVLIIIIVLILWLVF